MERLHIKELLKFTQGSILQHGGSKRVYVYNISTDSRSIGKDEVFLCLKGKKFDGHDYILEASRGNGVIGVIIDKLKWSLVKQTVSKELLVIGVKDTLKAYQDIACHYLKKFKTLKKVGITGSNGKTSTKEILKTILSTKYKVLATEGNLNNQIGVPKTILKVGKGDEVCVIELGSGCIGDIKKLSRILNPDYSIITSIGIAHSEFLGDSKEEIAKEKLSITDHTKEALILNEDDASFLFLKDKSKVRVKSFTSKNRSFKVLSYDIIEGYKLEYNGIICTYKLFGEHNLTNLNFGILCSSLLGLNDLEIAEGIKNVSVLDGSLRNEIVSGYYMVIKDCYNANPGSMEAGLEFFIKLPIAKAKAFANKAFANREKVEDGNAFAIKRVVVLGDMEELGKESKKYHKELGYLLGKRYQRDITHVLTIGAFAKYIAEGAILGGFNSSNVYQFGATQKTKLYIKLKSILKAGDYVYFKASRVLSLEEVANKLIVTS